MGYTNIIDLLLEIKKDKCKKIIFQDFASHFIWKDIDSQKEYMISVNDYYKSFNLLGKENITIFGNGDLAENAVDTINKFVNLENISKLKAFW